MEEWADKEIEAFIETERDPITFELKPVIVIGSTRFSWEEFGKEIETYEGWRFNFKLY